MVCILKNILMKEIRSIYFCARQSTNPSAFLTETRGIPDYQPGDFCHHTVEDTSIKEEERKSLNLIIKYKNYCKNLSFITTRDLKCI